MTRRQTSAGILASSALAAVAVRAQELKPRDLPPPTRKTNGPTPLTKPLPFQQLA